MAFLAPSAMSVAAMMESPADSSHIAEELVGKALEAGARDNVTVIVIDVI